MFSHWALPTEKKRNQLRLNSSMEDLRKFYDAMLPQIDKVFEYLDKFQVGALSEPEKNLLNMTLSLAEIANAVELFKTQPGVIDGFPADRFKPIED